MLNNSSFLTSNIKRNKQKYIKIINKQNNIKINIDKLGFIVLRHVNCKKHDKYWLYCYNCIRKYYPEIKIIIIDDNSNYKFITNKTLYKTTVINSEYKGRGELLPYYYYIHNKLFSKAIIIHDSVYINSYIDTNIENYKFLWDFKHSSDQPKDELKMINLFNDEKLVKLYHNKRLWNGCFGGMSIISHDYLVEVNNKYDISKLLKCVKTRYNRCSFERVIACLLQKENKKSDTLLGNIHRYCKWGIRYSNINKYQHLPIIKTWSGR